MVGPISTTRPSFLPAANSCSHFGLDAEAAKTDEPLKLTIDSTVMKTAFE
jgi:hypothetical protein